MNKSAAAELEGSVERVTFYNPENGFSVVKLRVRGRREPVSVVGTLPAAQPGEVLVLSGQWRIDPRHGAQFEPQSAEIRRPSDTEGIIRYLGSGLIRQIGPVLARRIVETFGERTLEILDAAPGRVRDVPGIGRQRAEAIGAAWIDHRALRGIVTFLSEHHIDTRYAPRLLAAYGPDAPRILGANPYRLVGEVPGLGFAAADRLGQAIGVRQTSPARLQASVVAALQRASQEGHVRLAREQLVEAAAAEAVVDRALVEEAIVQQIAAGAIAGGGAPAGGAPAMPQAAPLPLFAPTPPDHAAPRPSVAGRLRIYEPELQATPACGLGIGLAGLVQAEEDLAARLLDLIGRPALEAERVQAWLAADGEAQALSSEQRRAVQRAACSGCFVLTGGPGVGKTTTTRVLVRCLQAAGRAVALAAPTGKAARRLSEVTGGEARTLHRLLGAGPQGFRHGPREPLPYDTVIVDEASMLDTGLARALVRASRPTAQLVLVGDADQLPSVGPGQVLRDLLACGHVPAASLTTVFRQASRSMIVANAHRIRQGLLPEFATPDALGSGADCIFVPAGPGQVARVGAYWAATRLPQELGLGAGEIQTLAPLTRVCQSLNGSLQGMLNPPQGQAERPHGALPLRVGDRVIQTRNNYTLGVFNGDTGRVLAIDAAELTVDFGDERAVTYGASDLLDLDHAYCLTVHRAQGSEWPGVVVLASSSYGPLLSRNLLYTALTRARRTVVVVGDEEAIAGAVARTRDQERSTGLAALLAAGEGTHGRR